MTLKALIILARAFCPWQPDPLPPTVILPRAVYEKLERASGLVNTAGLTTWWEVVPGEPMYARVYLREGADERILCHEWGHAVDGHWHP